MFLKLNVDLGGYKAGQVIKVADNNTYWRKRLKDSKIDNCVELFKKNKNKETKKEEKSIKEVEKKGGNR